MKKIVGYAAMAAVAGLAAFLLHQWDPAFFPGGTASVIDHTKPTLGPVQVARVVDGDTILIDGGEYVRLIGMNTPETVNPKKPVECYGPEASARTKELLTGQTVRLEQDTEDRDKYGRLLRYAFLGDQFINVELVQEGFAKAYPFPPNTKYRTLFTKAQKEARAAHLGLWAACH